MEVNDKYVELISRYLNGQADKCDVDTLHNWISEKVENKRLFFSLKDVWDASAEIPDHREKYLLDFYRLKIGKKNSLKIESWKKIGTVAALLIIGLVTGYLVSSVFQPRTEGSLVYSVPLGSKSKLTLPDGTEVNLNSGTTFSYPADYSSINRTVTLVTGEAFFNVKSDPGNPFVVNTPDYVIKATGTQFNVVSYGGDSYSSAALIDGKISMSLQKSGRTLLLDPGQKIVFDRENNHLNNLTIDTETEIAWKDGLFIFKNIPFPELIRRLERWYDVKLIFNSPKFNELRFTGRFKNQETIWQVLDALQLTSSISYRKSDFREFEIIYKPK